MIEVHLVSSSVPRAGAAFRLRLSVFRALRLLRVVLLGLHHVGKGDGMRPRALVIFTPVGVAVRHSHLVHIGVELLLRREAPPLALYFDPLKALSLLLRSALLSCFAGRTVAIGPRLLLRRLSRSRTRVLHLRLSVGSLRFCLGLAPAPTHDFIFLIGFRSFSSWMFFFYQVLYKQRF